MSAVSMRQYIYQNGRDLSVLAEGEVKSIQLLSVGLVDGGSESETKMRVEVKFVKEVCKFKVEATPTPEGDSNSEETSPSAVPAEPVRELVEEEFTQSTYIYGEQIGCVLDTLTEKIKEVFAYIHNEKDDDAEGNDADLSDVRRELSRLDNELDTAYYAIDSARDHCNNISNDIGTD